MFQFIAKVTDNGAARTIRGRIDTDSASDAIERGISQLAGTLKKEEIDPASVTVVMVKRAGGSSGFTVSAPKEKAAKKAGAAPAKRGGKK